MRREEKSKEKEPESRGSSDSEEDMVLGSSVRQPTQSPKANFANNFVDQDSNPVLSSPAKPKVRDSLRHQVFSNPGKPPVWFLVDEIHRPIAPKPVTALRQKSLTGQPSNPRIVNNNTKLVFLVVAVFVVTMTVVAIVLLGGVSSGEDLMTRKPQGRPTAPGSTPWLSGGTSSPAPTTTPSSSAASGEQRKGRKYRELPSLSPLPSAVPEVKLPSALQRNDLYAIPSPVLRNCPAPSMPQSEREWRQEIRKQWACLHEAWQPIFREHGWSTRQPAVKFYPGKGSKSACGYVEAPAFYCPRNGGTVFFGGEHFTMARKWRMSINEMVNHEYAHHIQAVSGITQIWSRIHTDHDQLNRRSELQAICMSAMLSTANINAEFDEADMQWFSERFSTMIQSDRHGHRNSLLFWGHRGLQAQVVGDCNTWIVDGQRVR